MAHTTFTSLPTYIPKVEHNSSRKSRSSDALTHSPTHSLTHSRKLSSSSSKTVTWSLLSLLSLSLTVGQSHCDSAMTASLGHIVVRSFVRSSFVRSLVVRPSWVVGRWSLVVGRWSLVVLLSFVRRSSVVLCRSSIVVRPLSFVHCRSSSTRILELLAVCFFSLASYIGQLLGSGRRWFVVCGLWVVCLNEWLWHSAASCRCGHARTLWAWLVWIRYTKSVAVHGRHVASCK